MILYYINLSVKVLYYTTSKPIREFNFTQSKSLFFQFWNYVRCLKSMLDVLVYSKSRVSVGRSSGFR